MDFYRLQTCYDQPTYLPSALPVSIGVACMWLVWYMAYYLSCLCSAITLAALIAVSVKYWSVVSVRLSLAAQTLKLIDQMAVSHAASVRFPPFPLLSAGQYTHFNLLGVTIIMPYCHQNTCSICSLYNLTVTKPYTMKLQRTQNSNSPLHFIAIFS